MLRCLRQRGARRHDFVSPSAILIVRQAATTPSIGVFGRWRRRHGSRRIRAQTIETTGKVPQTLRRNLKVRSPCHRRCVSSCFGEHDFAASSLCKTRSRMLASAIRDWLTICLVGSLRFGHCLRVRTPIQLSALDMNSHALRMTVGGPSCLLSHRPSVLDSDTINASSGLLDILQSPR